MDELIFSFEWLRVSVIHILYSFEWGRVKSIAWLTAFLLSFLESVILIQPLKVTYSIYYCSHYY